MMLQNIRIDHNSYKRMNHVYQVRKPAYAITIGWFFNTVGVYTIEIGDIKKL